MTYKELKPIFRKKEVSVVNFEGYLATLPEEEQRGILEDMFRLTLTDRRKFNNTYLRFFCCFVKKYAQMYHDFLHQETLLGDLRYKQIDSLFFLLLIEIFEKEYKGRTYSRNRLLFSYLISFKANKIEGLNKIMGRNHVRLDKKTEEELKTFIKNFYWSYMEKYGIDKFNKLDQAEIEVLQLKFKDKKNS